MLLTPETFESNQKYLWVSFEFVQLSKYLQKVFENRRFSIELDEVNKSLIIKGTGRMYEFNDIGFLLNSSGSIYESKELAQLLRKTFSDGGTFYIFLDDNFKSIQQTKYTAINDDSLGF